MNNSYVAGADAYVKGDFAITSTGVVMKGTGRAFTVNPSELEWGETIGRGASGTVVKSRHKPTGTILALKVIKMFEKGNREQLMREIHALFDSECLCLVTFYGAFLKDSSVALALEYMDGGSLENVVHQLGAIPESVLSNITYQILYGLSYLKTKRRVHRDIKPSNILLNSKGEVKLTDFGIAKELRESFAHSFVGTYKYMSPERIRHKPYSYSSDIWSLGLVLIESATGHYPYQQHKTHIDMIQSVLESPPPSLSTEYFSYEFSSFISNCLHKSPTDRASVDVLLTAPWFTRYGAHDLLSARRNVHEWITNECRG